MGVMGGLLGTSGGVNGTGLQGPNNANIVDPVTQAQINKTYGQYNTTFGQQQSLLQALQAQQGIQNQSNVYGQLQNVVAGQGPNPAQAMLNQATGQNVANQAALMAGQRGAGANVGLMARQAAQQGAATQQNAVGQAAALQAQQSLGALGQAGNIAGNQVANQMGQTNANTAAAQAEQQALLNAQTAYNNAQVGMQSNINNVYGQLANTTMQGQQALYGGLMNSLSTMGGMFGGGGGGGGMAGGAAAAGAKGGDVKMCDEGGEIAAPDTSTPTFAPDAGAAALGKAFPGSDSKSGGSSGGGSSSMMQMAPMMAAMAAADGLDTDQQAPAQVQAPVMQQPAPVAQQPQQGPVSAFGKLVKSLGSDKSGSPNTSTPQFSGGAGALYSGVSSMGKNLSPLFQSGPSSPQQGAVNTQATAGQQPPGQMQANMEAKGGMVKDYKKGGSVKAAKAAEKAAKSGNSYSNDKIPAVLSEHEIVLPRSVTMSTDPVGNAAKFVQSVLAKRKAKNG